MRTLSAIRNNFDSYPVLSYITIRITETEGLMMQEVLQVKQEENAHET